MRRGLRPPASSPDEYGARLTFPCSRRLLVTSNVLLLGIGGLVWIPPLYFWGRLPVLFWTQLLGTLMVLGSVLVTSFNQYYVLRPLTSLFLTAGQTIGLTFVCVLVLLDYDKTFTDSRGHLAIHPFVHLSLPPRSKDMFYFHEHARKIGLWVCVFLTAPYTGPLLGKFSPRFSSLERTH